MQVYEVSAKVVMERVYYVEAGHRDDAEDAARRMAGFEGRDPYTYEPARVLEAEGFELSRWDMTGEAKVHKAREVREADETNNLDWYWEDGW